MGYKDHYCKESTPAATFRRYGMRGSLKLKGYSQDPAVNPLRTIDGTTPAFLRNGVNPVNEWTPKITAGPSR